jgi:hydrogenase maturation protein HypF
MAPPPPSDEDNAAAAFRVRGLVQGVGFRPAVWRLARREGLTGDVLNDGEGVLIRAWGSAAALAAFEAALLAEAPPLSLVDSIERLPLTGFPSAADFRIIESRQSEVSTGVVPDAATCPDCLADIRDPAGRRHRYAFTNCTNCGPRLSIVRAVPYDRATTSMASFVMCPDCQAEYEHPADRRFHAQPNACPVCGPRVWLEDKGGVEASPAPYRDAIEAAAARIAAGEIVAVKGIGGFHLACDAANAEAVSRLRARKRRYHKPFALMARDMEMIAAYAQAGPREQALLTSAAAPVVVLERSDTAPPLAPGIAPGQASLGFMLPYTPLHHLLMAHLGGPIVLTSGNRSEEPQCTGNEEARQSLAELADCWLMHDRDIVNRLDDSVAHIMAGSPCFLRRARGYAPAPVPLSATFAAAPKVLAMGGELKNTFCLLSGGQAIVSQHIGDLEDAATHADFRASLGLYRGIFRFAPEVIAVDAHPDYLSTQWGRMLADETGVTLARVQHHHAHIASVLAEAGAPLDTPPVLGIVLDGLGFAEDGALWGGEFLLADFRHYERLAHFAPIPLLGGAKAMREPWRNALAHLCWSIGWDEAAARYGDLGIIRALSGKPVATAITAMERGVNSPPASSAGRLFDAAAAMLGICVEGTSYEGQAAVELEALAAPAWAKTADGYAAGLADGSPARLEWGDMWRALLGDVKAGVSRADIAARFHRGLAGSIARTAALLASRRGVERIVLGGGVFQNRLLLEGVTDALQRSGLTAVSPRLLPANDGGLSLGQAVIAAARTMV